MNDLLCKTEDFVKIHPVNYRIDSLKFRKLLAVRGYTSLSRFADDAEVHRNTISAYLSGAQSIFTNAMGKIVTYLSADPMDLIVAKLPGPAGDIPNIGEILPVAENLAKTEVSIAVFIIGSRARGTAQTYSDWDLGLTGGEHRLTSRDYLRLKSRADDWRENLVRDVDLVNLDTAPSWFLRDMRPRPVYLAGNREAAAYFWGVWDAHQRQNEKTRRRG